MRVMYTTKSSTNKKTVSVLEINRFESCVTDNAIRLYSADDPDMILCFAAPVYDSELDKISAIFTAIDKELLSTGYCDISETGHNLRFKCFVDELHPEF